ncbi:MAG: glycosyltransferase [Planctomycetaceae bacterium]|nr:glycosyltransferase [Planctomycetaceae bacterium]
MNITEAMLKDRSIICFAPSDWWGMNPSCTTHLIKRFARHNRVLYVNPFSSDLLGVTGGKRKGVTGRVIRKLKSLAKWLRKADENLYIFSPVFIPVQGSTSVDRINNMLLIFQLRVACGIVGIRDPLIWMENLRAADLLKHYRNCYTLFHVSDLFTHDGYVADKSVLRQREQAAIEASRAIICVSETLYGLYHEHRKDVHYIPHGVEFDRFYQAAQENVMPPELKGVPKPIAGYFGTLTGSNDIALWEMCAERLKDVSFVFAGRITGGDYSGLQSKANVRMLGPLPYERIPAVCAGFDVCMLAWKISPWIKSCNPLKLFEYMACGKPVVSVAIEEARKYADVISVASSAEEFCRLIRWELDHDTPQRRQKRIDLARANDWEQKVEQFSAIINEGIGRGAAV